MTRIKYNKEKPGRILSRGDPRDIQLRQRLVQEQRAKRTVEAESGLHPTMVGPGTEKPKEPEVDLSQYLPLGEVKARIEAAVEFTRESEKERYESGLRNLNDQLKEVRKKAKSAEEKLINAHADINRLKTQLVETPDISETARQKLTEKDLEIIKLTSELSAKEELLKTKEDIYTNLQVKMDKIYERISDGSIQSLVGKNRPELEDKIFIDPIEKKEEPKLDSHINIKEEKSVNESSGRDMDGDLVKLRNLLKL